jgi:hypothetical protein
MSERRSILNEGRQLRSTRSAYDLRNQVLSDQWRNGFPYSRFGFGWPNLPCLDPRWILEGNYLNTDPA